METLLAGLIPGVAGMRKTALLTHADVDHGGLLPDFEEILTSEKSAKCLALEYRGEEGFREQNPLHKPYIRICKDVYKRQTLLNSRQGSSPDTIYGYWSIDIVLPANRNNKGTLKLRDASGVELLSCECLGLSVSNDSMTTYEGNTPTGTYTGYLYGPVDPSGSYGPYKVINMTGVSGVIISSGRSGIWIHGGNPEPDTTKPNYPLQATHGCVRVTNSNQLTLQNLITNLISSEDHYTTGNISISQS